MPNYSGSERRKYPRIEKNFVISYRVYGDTDNIDISQTRNISEGGMLLTTNRLFDGGVVLAIEIRLPFLPDPIRLIGKVIDSREIARNLIYETRLLFTYVDDKSKVVVKDTVNYFSKKDSK